jgi:hypothetical protein
VTQYYLIKYFDGAQDKKKNPERRKLSFQKGVTRGVSLVLFASEDAEDVSSIPTTTFQESFYFAHNAIPKG